LHSGFLNAKNYSEKIARKKKKDEPKKKCSKDLDELRKSLKTYQDVLDCAHPNKPYVSSSIFLFYKEKIKGIYSL